MWLHLRSNAIAYLALVVALSGTAYAVTKVGPAQIKKNAVRAKHIKDGQVKGPEVDEATLGKVPAAARADSAGSADSAATADSAKTAGSAATADSATRADSAASADLAATANSAATAALAANSNLLGGLSADQFLRASDLDVKGPTVINDPPGGPPTTEPFLTVGPVSITASCNDTGAGRQLTLIGTGPTAAPGSGARVGVNGGLMGDFDAPVYGGAPQNIVLSGGVTTSDNVRPGVLTVFDPAAGTNWIGNFWLSVNMGGDCAFGLVGMSTP